MEKDNRKKNEAPAVFKAGAVSLAFLIIGYQVALFVHRASVERIASVRDHPDTVYVIDPALAASLLSHAPSEASRSGYSSSCLGEGEGEAKPESRRTQCRRRHSEPLPHPLPDSQPDGRPKVVVRRYAEHSEVVSRVREQTRQAESFRFNPNTVSVEDLQKLGFTSKQAQSIDSYRQKGGRFRRKSDFAKSFVVPDSVYRRLEKYIDIPLLDINLADSAAFDALPGIGGYFAARMVEHREALGGYSYPEQLMDIWHFDRVKFDALSDLICCSPPRDSFDLWHLGVEELRSHPYIRSFQTARSIVFFRDNNPASEWTVASLQKAGILSQEDASRLSRCAVKHP